MQSLTEISLDTIPSLPIMTFALNDLNPEINQFFW
jgi:hypothetical protein